jgi:hypothetical protein
LPVIRSTVAPSEPSSASADDDLRTRTELNSSEAKALKSKARERLGLAPASLLAPVDSASMLLIRTRLKSPLRPRTLIVRPSPLSRSIEMPGRRCRDSARFESGKSAMSSALMASSMTSEVFLVSMALRSEAR